MLEESWGASRGESIGKRVAQGRYRPWLAGQRQSATDRRTVRTLTGLELHTELFTEFCSHSVGARVCVSSECPLHQTAVRLSLFAVGCRSSRLSFVGDVNVIGRATPSLLRTHTKRKRGKPVIRFPAITRHQLWSPYSAPQTDCSLANFPLNSHQSATRKR